MRLHKIFTILILSATAICGYAQTPTVNIAHSTAHKQQLANIKSRLDKTVIQDFIKHDIENREAELSAQSRISEETETLINDLISEANRHLGKKYRSGAKGPNAFDCSGFSSYVFRQFGYSLAASSGAQFNQGTPVDKHDLRKGDLVFFTGRNRKRGVGHVGIVVSADNEKGTFRFIHASTSQGIRVDGNDGY